MWKFFVKRKRRKQISDLRACRHAWDDLLTPEQRLRFDKLISDLQDAPPEDAAAARRAADALRAVEIPDRHPRMREFLDLLLVVGAVAFGLRGLFFQPFQIPTGSMQPTFYGIHYQSADNFSTPRPGVLPGWLAAALFGHRRAAATVESAGAVDPGSFRTVSGLFSTDTSFDIGGRRYTLPGDANKVAEYAFRTPELNFAAGHKLADGFLSVGDHLFVERFSIYLTSLKRGDVTVFNTDGLLVDGRPIGDLSGFYYIKRLAGLPGDTLKIVDDVLMVRPAGAAKFQPVYELDPRFRRIYSGKGGYQGHVTGIGEFFLAGGSEYVVPRDHYFMLGDNSNFSLDSRFFGAVPRRNLIGRAWLIFWPFTRRWGWADRVEAPDIPTGEAEGRTFPSMFRQ